MDHMHVLAQMPPYLPACLLPAFLPSCLPGAGEEIWSQTHGQLHAFVSGAGTGGTIAGVSRYLKQRDPHIRVFLIDPPGSGLYNKVGSC